MNMLKIYTREYVNTLYRSGDGEVKFGEKVQTVNAGIKKIRRKRRCI